MQLNTIKIDGFGVLSQLEIDHLSSGLSVIYGSNGSGKTTVLEFLRGMFCNFDQARKHRLLPPLKGGRPGGGITVSQGSSIYEITRHARPGHQDTLAIKTHVGDPQSAVQVRTQFSQLNREFINTLFFVSGPEAHSLSELVHFAISDGVDLRTERRQQTWIAERIEVVEQERKDLFGPEPSRKPIEALEQRRQCIQVEVAERLEQQSLRDLNWHQEVSDLQYETSRLRSEANWLYDELQTVQTDLTEVQDRLWSRVETVVEEVQPFEIPVPSPEAEWVAEIHEIDRQIVHAQQVLRDLANSRFRLSLATAELTGTETPKQDVVFERQRDAIAAMEAQTQKLALVVLDLQESGAGARCLCMKLQGEIKRSLVSIQQQTAMLCQELSRQQVASEQSQLFSQREGVDRCEVELTRQIQSLRLRRDELVHSTNRTTEQRLQFCTIHETAYCRCESHQIIRQGSFVSESALREERRPITTRQVVMTSLSRPEDPVRQLQLQDRKTQLQEQWWNTLDRLSKACTRLDAKQLLPADFAADDTLLKLRQEQKSIEQQLADAREQWQSLAVLQTVLQRTRAKLQEETASPVIEEASGLLKKMTQGRYTAFRFHPQLEELQVLSDTNFELPVHALSRGTLEQAALCFRMALWSEYCRRGLDLPLVLDEVLADSDEHRLTAAIQTLVEFGRNRQVLFLTCQEHLVNLFEASGVVIRSLPGSPRTRSTVNRIPDTLVGTGRLSNRVHHSEMVEAESLGKEGLDLSLDRIQPDSPYWLQAHSAVSLIPSLGEQMARRIGAIGVRTISDLIELDPENTEIPIESLQISAATLRGWQAEGRLLTCVPDLTGRDVQLLVLCGVYSPSELAEANAEDLYSKAVRLRENDREYAAQGWLTETLNWPDLEKFGTWIRNGQRARSFRTARDEAQQRQRSHGPHRTPAPHLSRHISSDSTTSRLKERQLAESRSATAQHDIKRTTSEPSLQTVKLHSIQKSVEGIDELRFFLNRNSPLVDAPSIGPKTAELFEKIGVTTVSDFIHRDATEMSERLGTRRLTESMIREWQQQAILVCCVPELRGHDAQVLVACGITEVDEMSRMSPTALYAVVAPFVNSEKGQRLLRSAKTPDLQEVTEWIHYANCSRSFRAA